MYESESSWREVDRYFIEQLTPEDPVLCRVHQETQAAGLPAHEVAPNQAGLLSLLCHVAGARRVLEFGTLAGYSTIWFARAVGEEGVVLTLERDPTCARVAESNLRLAGVAERVRLIVGPAAESAAALIAAGERAFDVVFIDADKENNVRYLQAAVRLSHPGTLIIADNVVRNGAVADPSSDDPRVRGSRGVIEAMGSDPRLEATALQTVGVKGWDGFAIARVK